MKSSKLKKLLVSLTEEEFKKLKGFIGTGYYNTDPNLLQLYEAVKNHYPNFDSSKMEKKALFKKVFPNSKWQDAKWRNLSSKMTALVEEYMISLELKSSPLMKKRLLTQSMKRRNLHQYFVKNTKNLLAELAAQPYRDEHFFYQYGSLLQDWFFHVKSNQLEMKEELLTAIDCTEGYHRLLTSKWQGELRALKRNYSQEERKFSSPFLKDNLEIRMFDLVDSLDNQKNQEHYFELKELFLKHHEGLRFLSKKIVFKHILSFAVRLSVTNLQKWKEEALSLYKWADQKGFLLHQNEITSTTFLNVILLSARTKQFTYARFFLSERKNNLAPALRDDLYALGKAHIYYEEGNFEHCLIHLSQAHLTHPIYILVARGLSLRSSINLVEKDRSYVDLASSLCMTFEKYLLRKKAVGNKMRNKYWGFIRASKVLISIYYENEDREAGKKKIENILNQNPDIIYKNWLLEKIGK